MTRTILAGLLALSISGAALAQSPGDLTVRDAWCRATFSAMANAAVYLTIMDSGNPDMLVSASTPVAVNAQLHNSLLENGIRRMVALSQLPVDKDHPIVLSPDGYHFMLTGMKQQLKAGETFPLTLSFAHAGAMQTTVTVRPVNADAPDMGGMDMRGMAH